MRPWIYRTAALLAFLIAQLLVLVVPLEFKEPDDWGFQYAVGNYAQGRLTLTDEQYVQQSQEAWSEGGALLSYAKIREDRWVFTPSPGHVLFLVPFERIGATQFGATLLSLGLVAILYLLLTRISGEKTALLGVVLLIFSPLYLAMWQRVYVDALAALAFCGIGGGLYVYYWLSRPHLSTRMGAAILFAAGLLLMASVGVRSSNIAIVAVFGAHFLIMAVRSHLRRENYLLTALVFGAGVALPLAGLLIYQGAVFGSPFSTGNSFAQLPTRFAWSYDLGIGFSIVRDNVTQLWAPLIMALPILMVAAPAFVAVAYGKGFFSCRPDTWPELPAHIYHILWAWVVAVFGVYMAYEWTSFQAGAQLPFQILTRYYLPALLPMVIVVALVLRRLSAKLWGSILIALTILGIVFFIQVARVQVYFMIRATPPDMSMSASFESAMTLPEGPTL